MVSRRELPRPRTTTDKYLGEICGLLVQILDRLPAPTPEQGRGGVELREPAARIPVDGGEGSPDPAGQGESGPDATPRRPARRAPAGKTTRTRRTTKKET